MSQRVVFDTNIIVSGYLWSGAPYQAIQLAQIGSVKPLISEAILDELKDVLTRPKFTARLQVKAISPDQIIEAYLQLAEIISVTNILSVVKADPDDDMVIACAVSGQAKYIVSGDPHLLQLQFYETIPVLDVHQFLQLFQKE